MAHRGAGLWNTGGLGYDTQGGWAIFSPLLAGLPIGVLAGLHTKGLCGPLSSPPSHSLPLLPSRSPHALSPCPPSLHAHRSTRCCSPATSSLPTCATPPCWLYGTCATTTPHAATCSWPSSSSSRSSSSRRGGGAVLAAAASRRGGCLPRGGQWRGGRGRVIWTRQTWRATCLTCCATCRSCWRVRRRPQALALGLDPAPGPLALHLPRSSLRGVEGSRWVTAVPLLDLDGSGWIWALYWSTDPPSSLCVFAFGSLWDASEYMSW